jgi:hypothetical protein
VIRLRPPRYEQVVRLINPERYAANPRQFLIMELDEIISDDGDPEASPDPEAVVDDPATLAGVLRQRAELYESMLEQGRVEAVCPRCATPTELDLAFYVLALRLPPWRAVDGAAIATPALADPEPPAPSALRPYDEPPVALRGVAPRPREIPRAARLDFVLPSARAGLTSASDPVRGTLGDVDGDREAAAWRQWAPAGRVQPAGRNYRRRDQPGFRAALRLSVAIQSLSTENGEPIESTVDNLERLFLCDVQFVDVLYTATHALPVETPSDGSRPRAAIACQCGEFFLPIR